MEKYKTIIGTRALNKYVELGWKQIHVFTIATAFGDDEKPVQHDAAFVIFWDAIGEPIVPSKQQYQNVEPLPVPVSHSPE
jgi:hypothetical protein